MMCRSNFINRLCQWAAVNATIKSAMVMKHVLRLAYAVK